MDVLLVQEDEECVMTQDRTFHRMSRRSYNPDDICSEIGCTCVITIHTIHKTNKDICLCLIIITSQP